MRDCVKNKQALYYAEFEALEELKDINGDYTGSFKKTYKTKKIVYKNVISSDAGLSSHTADNSKLYGLLVKHRKVIASSEPFTIGMNDIFWLVDEPEKVYVVGGLYTSLNTLYIGLDLLVGESPYIEEEIEDGE